MINTSGGIAGGDRLRVSIRLSMAPPSLSRARLRNASIAHWTTTRRLPWRQGSPSRPGLAWSGCRRKPSSSMAARMHRTLRVEMAGDATFLAVESLVFGRAAMGEHVGSARISDTIEVLRDGVLLLHDAIRMPAERCRGAGAAGHCRRGASDRHARAGGAGCRGPARGIAVRAAGQRGRSQCLERIAACPDPGGGCGRAAPPCRRGDWQSCETVASCRGYGCAEVRT